MLQRQGIIVYFCHVFHTIINAMIVIQRGIYEEESPSH